MIMREFIVVGHLAKTTPDFSLEDLPGTSGRMDILCRCINSAFFISHGLRRDVICYLVLCGGNEEKTLRLKGDELRHLNPDERTTAALIKKALAIDAGNEWTRSTPGIYVRIGGLEKLLDDKKDYPLYYLREDGRDLREDVPMKGVFILGDHQGMRLEEEELLASRNAVVLSLGDVSLHADHCIILINHELDRALPNQQPKLEISNDKSS